MSTIVVVQKDGVACIGADTMSSLGPLRQRADHVSNCSKITRIDDTFIGLTGTSASLVVLRSYFANPDRPRDFSSTDGFFETLRHAHHVLKSDYHMTSQPRNDDEYETTQFYGLAANESGIFALYSCRTCQQFNRFWAAGSGRDFALGAMQVAYDEAESAVEVAEIGLAAAAEFDGGTGEPFEIHEVPLKKPTRKRARKAAPRKSGSRKTGSRKTGDGRTSRQS